MDNLHHIVVVGGGAGGLELVTRLGRKLGKKGKARISLVDGGLTISGNPFCTKLPPAPWMQAPMK